jgi:hypothetical protein
VDPRVEKVPGWGRRRMPQLPKCNLDSPRQMKDSTATRQKWPLLVPKGFPARITCGGGSLAYLVCLGPSSCPQIGSSCDSCGPVNFKQLHHILDSSQQYPATYGPVSLRVARRVTIHYCQHRTSVGLPGFLPELRFLCSLYDWP